MLDIQNMVIRTPNPESDDFSNIINEWLDSYMVHGAFSSPMNKEARSLFRNEHKPTVIDLMGFDKLQILSSDDLPEEMVGWTCGEFSKDSSSVMHYIYIEKESRGKGLGKYLFESIYGKRRFINTSHHTWMLKKFLKSLKVRTSFNPYFSKDFEYGRGITGNKSPKAA